MPARWSRPAGSTWTIPRSPRPMPWSSRSPSGATATTTDPPEGSAAQAPRGGHDAQGGGTGDGRGHDAGGDAQDLRGPLQLGGAVQPGEGVGRRGHAEELAQRAPALGHVVDEQALGGGGRPGLRGGLLRNPDGGVTVG